jgi:glycosidase
MNSLHWYQQQADITLTRILPQVETALKNDRDALIAIFRLRTQFPIIFRLMHQLYGDHYDFVWQLEDTVLAVLDMWKQRPDNLRTIDATRENDNTWFQSQNMMGGVCYVDLYADTLDGLRKKRPYFEELGLTYLHLMPLFRAPDEQNDGGYAVSSFREVAPRLGTTDELRTLASEFREHGISLVLDFVFNHTSDEHEWAQKALAGDEAYQAYYRMFDDRTLPDLYEPYLREIFPENAPGSFTYRPEISKWVWTTFNTYQWDLNYENPAVFRAMLTEMLYIANQGIDFVRLDAVPFIWKQIGTNCENLPEAHVVIQALNAFTRIGAPGLLFKSEAIVHPRDIASYISPNECQISYNPTLMVCLWEALATRQIKLLQRSMQAHFPIAEGCAWINYIRSHDDIGWGFADEDAAHVGINGNDHRHFLNMYYTHQFPGSHARGYPFNYNPHTQDMRISGTSSSLAGLEAALESNDPQAIEFPIRRLVMIQSVVLSAGGIPLLYLGDELGTLNYYGYTEIPAIADDNRWLHRPPFQSDAWERRKTPNSIEWRVFSRLLYLIGIRKKTKAFAGSDASWIDSGNEHVLAYIRSQEVLILANFSEHIQVIHPSTFRLTSSSATNLIDGHHFDLNSPIELEPYDFMWLELF